MPFPATRMRRLRSTDTFRSLVRETELSPAHLIMPAFVIAGEDVREEIPSMPGVERYSISHLVEHAGEVQASGIGTMLLFARLEKHPDPRGSVAEMLELTGLGERRGEIVARLSGGNQQRINIAIGLLSRPSVLLLDEPSVGLDPRQRARLWEFVSALAVRGTTVIFSTHDIQEAERYGRRMLVLADGEALFDGSADELREAVRHDAADPGASDRDFETAFVTYLQHRGH